MPEVTHATNINPALPPEPGATELLEEVASLSSGLGLGFMSFLGAIPGLLPGVVLAIAALVIVAIPMVIVGVIVGAMYFLVGAIARAAGRAASIFRRPAPEPERARVWEHGLQAP